MIDWRQIVIDLQGDGFRRKTNFMLSWLHKCAHLYITGHVTAPGSIPNLKISSFCRIFWTLSWFYLTAKSASFKRICGISLLKGSDQITHGKLWSKMGTSVTVTRTGCFSKVGSLIRVALN